MFGNEHDERESLGRNKLGDEGMSGKKPIEPEVYWGGIIHIET